MGNLGIYTNNRAPECVGKRKQKERLGVLNAQGKHVQERELKLDAQVLGARQKSGVATTP